MTELSRRSTLRAAAAAGLGLTAIPFLNSTSATAVGAAGTSAAPAAPGGFPDFKYLGVAFNKDDLKYNPTGELIFPCVRGARGRVPNARARYYLYYAPHDKPGGICLAYADSLEGPFTEYPHNPIVSNVWKPHYDVSHVSSPHVIWREDHREMWLYFHGENTTTRLARSKDGIHFHYDKVVLSADMMPPGTKETSYARVFAHSLPSRGANYVMLFMHSDRQYDRRSIAWGWSADGRNWEFDQKPLIHPDDVDSQNIAAPALARHNGSTYVIYHQNIEAGGNMLITEVGDDFSKRNHLGVFHAPMSGPPDNGRCASASFGSMDGEQYMIYEAGARLEGAIAIAKAV